MNAQNTHPTALLQRAREGDTAALNRLLQTYQNYLMILARTQIDTVLQVRLAPSDLAQETLLEACQDFGHFRGRTEGEFITWLRRILVRNLADQVKRHQSQKRDVRRRHSLQELLDRSSAEVQRALAERFVGPLSETLRRERAVVLSDALARLPESHREVIILRHLEGLSFAEVAARMGRSSGAVRMLWARALEKLRGELEELS